jgi:two-component system, cell cycle response regulator
VAEEKPKPGHPSGFQPRRESGGPQGGHGWLERQARKTTRPDMPAVDVAQRPSFPSWVDADEPERITEVTDLSLQPRVAPRSAKDRPVIVRLDGARAGEIHSFTTPSLTLGRHATNQLRIDDPGISRFHVRFSTQEGGFFVEDLGSRNGTFVAGKRQGIAELHDGDIIQLGPRVTLRFSLLDEHQEKLMRQLYESSTIDGLTGIHNRKHFEERLHSEIAFAQRHSTKLALILLDVDHFKSVNDRFGHSAGDEVLRQVARSVQQRLRVEDVFGRFGGEEFAIVLRGVSREGAARLAERLRATVAAVPYEHAGQPIPVTISAGCAALACASEPTASALIELADERLYRAKRSGRNRVVATS